MPKDVGAGISRRGFFGAMAGVIAAPKTVGAAHVAPSPKSITAWEMAAAYRIPEFKSPTPPESIEILAYIKNQQDQTDLLAEMIESAGPVVQDQIRALEASLSDLKAVRLDHYRRYFGVVDAPD